MLMSIETCFYYSHLFTITLFLSHSFPLPLNFSLLTFQQSFFKNTSIPTDSNFTLNFSFELPSVRQSSPALQGNCFCQDAHDLHIAKFSVYFH